MMKPAALPGATLNRAWPVRAEGGGVQVEGSERALVPLASELVGPPPVPDDRINAPRLLAAAMFGLAVEAQRRSLHAADAVAGRFGRPLRVLARPAMALARGSVAVARCHLDLDGWAALGLTEQQRAQEVAAKAVRALIAALAAAVLDEIDLDQVVARVDLDRIVDRVDPNQIAARIDPDAIVGRVDLDAVLARIDLPGLTEQLIDEVDLGEIIRESSSTMASESVDALRVQGMRVDGLVSRIVDRILLRDGQRQTDPVPGQLRP
jgi:hypothetical protein